jgi:DNA-binding transcriptional LysR family regulator
LRTEDLKLREINLFLELSETKSVRELARQHNLQPGHLSKMIRSLEQKLGFILMERSNSGIRLTAKAAEILPFLRDFHTLQTRLEGAVSEVQQEEVLSFASTSFFSTHFVPEAVAKLSSRHPGLRLRMIDLPPSLFIPVGLRGAFQFCIHLGDLDWPKTWTSTQVGLLRWHLCCRAGHPLVSKPSAKEALKYPFVYPVYWTHEGIRYGDDHCPIPIGKRVRGHETTTALSAREMVRETNHIGFLPELVIRQSVARGELETITIASWKPVKQPVYLSVKNDSVKQRAFEEIRGICRQQLVFQ